jgi:hypothetical protein
MSFLDHIRSKPREVRVSYAFGFAAVITGLIAVVWGSTLPARFSPPSSEDVSEKDSFGGFLDKTKSQLGSLIQTDAALENPNTLPEPDPDSALGQLGSRVANTDEVSASLNEVSRTEEKPAILIEERKSKIILIATTTSQKTE